MSSYEALMRDVENMRREKQGPPRTSSTSRTPRTPMPPRQTITSSRREELVRNPTPISEKQKIIEDGLTDKYKTPRQAPFRPKKKVDTDTNNQYTMKELSELALASRTRQGGYKYEKTGIKYKDSRNNIYVKGKEEYVRHQGKFIRVKEYEKKVKK